MMIQLRERNLLIRALLFQSPEINSMNGANHVWDTWNNVCKRTKLRKNEVRRITSWIQIPNLSIKLYNHRFLWQVRSTIGTTLKIDRATSIHSCGKFARIYVELDLSKKFVPCISVLGDILSIEYEGNFNALVHDFERTGGLSLRGQGACSEFLDCVSDCGLTNLGYIRFSNVKIKHLPMLKSDHSPLCL
ncbi:hypothetical protein Ahy_A07g031870 [Arachis hypogaea]|uniref:Uncharacterized protein n=1 Tax=Arachis hypogaea TaxID=3818 RepID=A0A445C5A9_ARAHY|nr:hypothetical protein Ahy_A07g031870 [Arachis hypogaea]